MDVRKSAGIFFFICDIANDYCANVFSFINESNLSFSVCVCEIETTYVCKIAFCSTGTPQVPKAEGWVQREMTLGQCPYQPLFLHSIMTYFTSSPNSTIPVSKVTDKPKWLISLLCSPSAVVLVGMYSMIKLWLWWEKQRVKTLNPMAKWNRKKAQRKLQSQSCHMCLKMELLFIQPKLVHMSSLSHRQVMFLPYNFKNHHPLFVSFRLLFLSLFLSSEERKNLERYKVSFRWSCGASG